MPELSSEARDFRAASELFALVRGWLRVGGVVRNMSTTDFGQRIATQQGNPTPNASEEQDRARSARLCRRHTSQGRKSSLTPSHALPRELQHLATQAVASSALDLQPTVCENARSRRALSGSGRSNTPRCHSLLSYRLPDVCAQSASSNRICLHPVDVVLAGTNPAIPVRHTASESNTDEVCAEFVIRNSQSPLRLR